MTTSEQNPKSARLCDDLRMAPQLVHPYGTGYAARNADSLFSQANRLSCVKWATDEDEKKRDDIIRIGWRQPEGAHDDTQTIWTLSKRQRPESLMLCAERLISFMGIERPDYVMLMRDPDFCDVPVHQDFINGKRGLLTLSGSKLVTAIPPDCPPASVNLYLEAGDAYEMTFAEDESSIEHGVQYFDGPNLTMFIDG